MSDPVLGEKPPASATTQTRISAFFTKAPDGATPRAALGPTAPTWQLSRAEKYLKDIVHPEIKRILGTQDESRKKGPKTAVNEQRIEAAKKCLQEIRQDLDHEPNSLFWSNPEYVTQPLDYLLREARHLVPTESGGDWGVAVRRARDADDDQEVHVTQEDKLSKATRLVMVRLTHVWDKNGRHLRFASCAEYRDRCADLIGFAPARSSAYRHLAQEEQRYNNGGGVRSRGNLAALLATAESIKDAHKAVFAKPDGEATQCGRPFLIKPEWYRDIADDLDGLLSIKGFSPRMALPVIEAVVYDKLRAERGHADVDEVTVSYEFGLWFLRSQMNLRFRRVESRRDTEDKVAEIHRLHNFNLDKLQSMLDKGMDKNGLIMSDQFGLVVLPNNERVWARRGETAYSDTKEDKRQITGNFWLRGDGSILRLEVTFAGAGQRCLPNNAAKWVKEFSDKLGVTLHVNFTSNHWANQETVTEAISDVGSLLRKEKLELCLYSIDCWPTHLTSTTLRAIEKDIPGGASARLVIPAGGTGTLQINDTDCHAPFKQFYGDEFDRWYGSNVKALRSRKKADIITSEKYEKEVAGLLLWSSLKEKVLGFKFKATERLLE